MAIIIFVIITKTPPAHAHLVHHLPVPRMRMCNHHAVGAQHRRLQVPDRAGAVKRCIVDLSLGLERVGHLHAHVHLQQRARVAVVPVPAARDMRCC